MNLVKDSTFGLCSANGHMNSNFFISSDTERADSVSSFALKETDNVRTCFGRLRTTAHAAGASVGRVCVL